VPTRGLLQGGCCRRHALCGAWRRQALPARGLHQVRCHGWHAPLHRARRWQAVPRGGLLKGSSRRHALQGARRRQALPAGGLLQVRCCCHGRHAPLHRARWGQAVPARGLLQVRCHEVLYPAWGRQAVPTRGLLQGGSRRRHATLYRAWRGQAVPAGGLLQASRSSSRQHALRALSAAHTAAARRCGGASTLSRRAATQLARTRGDPAAGGGLRINQFTAEASLGC
jgi:hypothetical protein